MRKLLFLIDTLGGGGAEKVLVTIVNSLVERYDITVQTLFDEGIYREKLNEQIKYRYCFKESGKNFRRIMQRVMKYTPSNLLYKWLISGNYDCEIAFLEGATTKIISGGNSSVRRVAWVHIDLAAFPDSISAFYPSKRTLFSAYSVFDTVCCVSKQAEESLKQVVSGNVKTKVVYNPINIVAINEKAKLPGDKEWVKRCFTFCTVGRLVQQKGFDRLLNAVKILKQEGKIFEVCIFGTGPEEKNLRSMAKNLDIEDVVRFLGFSSNVEYYMKKADVYICSSRAEGFSLTVAEAIALGVPVMSTDCTGPTEILNGGKFGILMTNSTDGIYKGMKQVIENPEILSDLQKKSIERRDFFNLDEVLNQICELVDGKTN